MEGATTWSFHSEVPSLFAIKNQYTHGPWKQVWNSKAPVEVMCFVWLENREAASFQDNLQRRGIQLVNRCYLCVKEESSNHHFL